MAQPRDNIDQREQRERNMQERGQKQEQRLQNQHQRNELVQGATDTGIDMNQVNDRIRAEYEGVDQPGLHPANRPSMEAEGERSPYKTTRDLEDITGNPGHRNVNPNAPATSFNHEMPDARDNPPSINEPPNVRQAPIPQQAGQPIQQQFAVEGSVASHNEPPGSVVIPPGAGVGGTPPIGEGGGAQPGGEQEPPDLLDLEPEVATIGGEDLTLTCTGENFTPGSKIIFNGGEEPTTFVNDTTVTTIVKPSTAQTPGEYPVLIRDAAGESEPLMFEFLPEAEAQAAKSRPKREKKTPRKQKRR